MSRQFSPPPPLSFTVISNKNSTNNIVSTIKNENYEDDLPPPPPPPPIKQSVQIIQNNCSKLQQQKQPLILDYQDPINIQYDAANLQFILPINVEPNTKPCNLLSSFYNSEKKKLTFFFYF